MSVKIDTKGGRISEVKLKEYKSYKDFAEGRNENLLLYSAKDAALELTLDTKESQMAFQTITSRLLMPLTAP